jgi:hypothetical protein
VPSSLRQGVVLIVTWRPRFAACRAMGPRPARRRPPKAPGSKKRRNTIPARPPLAGFVGATQRYELAGDPSDGPRMGEPRTRSVTLRCNNIGANDTRQCVTPWPLEGDPMDIVDVSGWARSGTPFA